jgi:hypothetical protein
MILVVIAGYDGLSRAASRSCTNTIVGVNATVQMVGNVLATRSTLSGHPKQHQRVAFLDLDISATTQCSFMNFVRIRD